MSGEFGSYSVNGYVNRLVESIANDCCGGSYELTRLWGQFFRKTTDVFLSICYAEAADSSEDEPIFQLIQDLPEIDAAFSAILAYMRPFVAVAREAQQQATREYLEKQQESSRHSTLTKEKPDVIDQ